MKCNQWFLCILDVYLFECWIVHELIDNWRTSYSELISIKQRFACPAAALNCQLLIWWWCLLQSYVAFVLSSYARLSVAWCCWWCALMRANETFAVQRWAVSAWNKPPHKHKIYFTRYFRRMFSVMMVKLALLFSRPTWSREASVCGGGAVCTFFVLKADHTMRSTPRSMHAHTHTHDIIINFVNWLKIFSANTGSV